jgi:hypothetical protein
MNNKIKKMIEIINKSSRQTRENKLVYFKLNHQPEILYLQLVLLNQVCLVHRAKRNLRYLLAKLNKYQVYKEIHLLDKFLHNNNHLEKQIYLANQQLVQIPQVIRTKIEKKNHNH